MRRRGFTLFELVVALAVSGLVLLALSALFRPVLAAADQVTRMRSVADAHFSRDALLRELAGHIEVGGDTSALFVGAPAGARFRSWTRVAGGWLEPALITLEFVRRGDSLALQLRSGTETRLAWEGPGPVALAYLRSAENGGEWLHRWGPSLAVPAAIRLVLGTDTLMLRIGPRG